MASPAYPDVMPDGFEKEIGLRVKDARLKRGLNMHQFGALIGASGQQVHKYETGINRISASRAACIARALEIPLDSFIPPLEGDNLPPIQNTASSRIMLEISKELESVPHWVQSRISAMVRDHANTYHDARIGREEDAA